MTPEEIQQAIEKLDNLWRTSQNQEAKEFAFELLDNLAIQEDPESLANVYNNLGIVYSHLSDYPKALEYHSKAIHIYEEIGNKVGIASTLGNIGIVYRSLSDYPKALEYFSKALQLFEEIGIKFGIGGNLVNIGLIYNSIKKYDTAFEYFSKALIILEEIGLKEFQANATSNIGLVYRNLSDYPKALEYYSKALQINEEIENKVSIASNLGNIGEVYLELLDYPKALEYSTISLGINEEINYKFGMAQNFGNIGIVYASKESLCYNVVIAEEYLQKTLLISNEIGAKELIRESYEQLHKLRLTDGRFEEALVYFKKSVEIEKEIQSEEAKNQALIFDQRRKLEEDQKARQLKLARFQEQERIFHNILPIPIANRLIEGEQTIADSYDKVSVFFSDFVGFTSLSSSIAPAELVQGLNKVFSAFDRVGTKYGLEKIKTIGDAYMAVCGLSEQFEDHQYRTAQFAVEILTVVNNLDLGENFLGLQIRIGLHCGSVVAGIIGEKKFAYDVWGDAVNIASRMESHSEAGRIHISEEFAKAIESYPEFSIVPRGEINIKGKGTMNTYWLEKSI